MLEHWIRPLNSSEIESFRIAAHGLGKSTHFSLEISGNAKQAAIIGADPKWAARVRRHLYRFSGEFDAIELFDLGNLMSPQPEFCVESIKELIDSQVVPIIIGARRDVVQPLFAMLRQNTKWKGAMMISETIPGWINEAANIPPMQFVGIQQHVTSRALIAAADAKSHTVIRLGQSRDSLDELEPTARTSTAVVFDANAMRQADLPAQKTRSSSGYCTEEACRILRYCGAASAVRCLVFTGHDPQSLAHDMSANTTAQILWYALSGLNARVEEKPEDTDKFTRYTLQLTDCTFDLTFFKSNRSGRWWVSIPGRSADPQPCAHEDYISACEDRISERLLRYIDLTL